MPKVTQEHIERRRSEILDAAKRVFMRKGFEPTTMQDVVEESGMSRGGVYQYFSSTEEMIEALHVESMEKNRAEVKELLSKSDTVWDVLEQTLDEYEEGNGESFGKVMYEYSVTSWRNERHRGFMRKRYLESRQIFVGLLQAGMDRGEFRPTQSLEAIVSFMFNVTDGLILHRTIIPEDSEFIKEQIEGLRIYLRTVLQVGK